MIVGHETQLCEILLRHECVHSEQIEEALELQKLRPKRIGQVLLDLHAHVTV